MTYDIFSNQSDQLSILTELVLSFSHLAKFKNLKKDNIARNFGCSANSTIMQAAKCIEPEVIDLADDDDDLMVQEIEQSVAVKQEFDENSETIFFFLSNRLIVLCSNVDDFSLSKHLFLTYL